MQLQSIALGNQMAILFFFELCFRQTAPREYKKSDRWREIKQSLSHALAVAFFRAWKIIV
jgi:hypothetical protein